MFSFLRDPRARLLERLPKGGVGAEVGVWKGDFSQALLETARPRALHLIDPWLFDASFPQRWYGGARAGGQADMDAIHDGVVAWFAGRTEVRVHRAPSLAAAATFADGTFDWVYIDGDHSADAVLKDLGAWRPKLRSGGLLCGDDYRWRDEQGRASVKDAVARFAQRFGLKPAVIRSQFVIAV
ncbi:MAG TPA: class I SAM-dependent methyltransferase [Rhizomicrobium sp.]|jgi:hypothetical protein|nr:class I SAM-dependent methyltransferase [Rhizomicrobium sp.]